MKKIIIFILLVGCGEQAVVEDDSINTNTKKEKLSKTPEPTPTPTMFEEVSDQAYKLTSEDCTDPDPTDLRSGATMMGCDGSTITGTMEPETLIVEVTPVPTPTIEPTATPTPAPTPDLSNLSPENVRDGVTIAGVEGTLIEESHSECTENNQQGCITNTLFVAADLTNLSASNIKSGVTVVGILGTYPSASSPLEGNTAAADLTDATFDARIKSAATFDYFDSEGNAYSTSGDPDIDAAKIKDGVVIFGTEGEVEDVADLVVSEDDLRYGVQVGDTTGALKLNCRNAADLSNFDAAYLPDNTITGGGPNGAVNEFDTILDYGQAMTIPTQQPINWSEEHFCDETSWVDETVGGSCSSLPAQCIFRERVSGLQWTGERGQMDWASAVADCDSLTTDGGGWRLPTSKELLAAHVHGIHLLIEATPTFAGSPNRMYWTATSESGYSAGEKYGVAVYLMEGINSTYDKDLDLWVMCVR